MNADPRQVDLEWLRGRNRRCCAVVTDPCAFGVAEGLRKAAEDNGTTGKLMAACRAMRAELDRTNEPLPAYRAGMRELRA